MNRAEKGWATRYQNEIAIIKEQLKTLREELYAQFLDFMSKSAKYQDLEREYKAMCRELDRFHRKHSRVGSLSLESEKI